MQPELTETFEEIKPQKKQTKESKISQRSEMAQEIITRHPDFMEKWALIIFLLILLLLFTMTWFIKYPDIIGSQATLTAANAPKEIVVRQEGRLEKLFIHNNERTSKGQVIGWIESTANHEEVLSLSRQIDSSIALLVSGKSEKVLYLTNKTYHNLGEIQLAYRDFITALQLFEDYTSNGFYSRLMSMLNTDIQSLHAVKMTIEDQQRLVLKDVKLAGETYRMNEQLFKDKVLSVEEFRKEESILLGKQQVVPQIENSILSNETQVREKQKELDQLRHDMAQQQIIFQQALQSLKSMLDDWKMKYVLQSPLDGKLYFIIPLQEKQFLQPGKVIGYTSPDDTHFYAETYLRQNNFGKIDTGLAVQLRFEAYPYQEYGFVEGTLNYVSNVPSDSGFLATIRLDKGLMTNNNKRIIYKSGLKAQAIVITKNLRLMERLYYDVVKSTSVNAK